MSSPPSARTRTVARIAAPLLFMGCGVFEVVSLALGRQWPGFIDELRVGFGLFNAALWFASALILALGTRKALYVPVLGALMLLTVPFVARAAGSPRELVYLAVMPLVIVFEAMDIRSVLGIARTGEGVRAAVPATA